MNIKISTNISNEFEDITINIQAPKMTEELQKIITNLSSISSIKEEVVATKNNEIFLLNTKEILYFYSDEKYNYAKTQNETYRIKEKLYELEENLPKNRFIRISNAYIINIEKTVSFDASLVGSLVAKMQDGTKQEVSKRRIKNVMKFLKERR